MLKIKHMSHNYSICSAVHICEIALRYISNDENTHKDNEPLIKVIKNKKTFWQKELIKQKKN